MAPAVPRDGAYSTAPARPVALPALTSLRFFAAMLVVVGHFAYYSLLPSLPVLNTIAAENRLGVSLFFVLSGFVLAYNYLDWFADDLRRTGRFLWYRVARIVPLYWLAHLLMTPVSLATLSRLDADIGRPDTPGLLVSWFLNLVMVQSLEPLPGLTLVWNDPAWSLSVEMVFYLLLPFFLRNVVQPIGARGWLAPFGILLWFAQAGLLALVAPLGRSEPTALFQLLAPFDEFAYKSPVFRLWEFLLGSLLGAGLLQHQREPESWGRIGRWLAGPSGRALALIGAGLGLIALVLVSRVGPGRSLANLTEWKWYVLPTPVWLLLLAGLSWGSTRLSRWLEHPWLVRLGEASFALYILHWIPVTLLAERVRLGAPPPLWLNLFGLLLTIVASLACYSWLEMPSRDWLRRFGESGRPGQAETVAPPAVAPAPLRWRAGPAWSAGAHGSDQAPTSARPAPPATQHLVADPARRWSSVWYPPGGPPHTPPPTMSAWLATDDSADEHVEHAD